MLVIKIVLFFTLLRNTEVRFRKGRCFRYSINIKSRKKCLTLCALFIPNWVENLIKIKM